MFSFFLFFFFCFGFPDVYCQTPKCADKYTLVANKCYQAFPGTAQSTHSTAETICRKDGGTLANIRSAIENRAVSVVASNNNLEKVWIGTFCFGNDTSKCVYDDLSGAFPNYSSFIAGYPLVTSNANGCVSMITTGSQAGRWISAKCNIGTIGAVCEVPAYYDNPGYDYRYDCAYFDGYCYIPKTVENSQLDNILKTCQQLGGLPMSIHSKRENDFVRNLDFRSVLLSREVYSQYDDGYGIPAFPSNYTWLDGTAWDYDNIDGASYNNGNNYCLSMDPLTGLWKHSYCPYENHFYCKVPLPSPQETSDCNSTFLMAPTVITSFGYPTNNNPSPCTWKIGTAGAYPLRISFRRASGTVKVYDGEGNNIGTASPYTSIVAPSNYITVVQTAGAAFYADVKPY